MTGNACKTKYPIIMVHGVGLRDNRFMRYWEKIPKTLEDEGAAVYFGGQDAWGKIEDNAQIVKNKILDILNDTGSEYWYLKYNHIIKL